MARKLRKLGGHGPAAEAAFGPDWCKGHFGGHGQRVMDAFSSRMHALGMEMDVQASIGAS
jgi:hypothetical protein